MNGSPSPVPAGTTPAVGRAVTRSHVIAGVYLVLAVVGLVGTWYFNLTYRGGDYLGDWFANPASSSAAVDVITVAVVASVLYLVEGRRLGWRTPVALVFIALSFLVAVAFALPLFLALRELLLARASRPRERQTSSEAEEGQT